MPSSLLETALHALKAEEEKHSLETGRGRGKDSHLERVGYSKGLLRAIVIVTESAKAVNKEDD